MRVGFPKSPALRFSKCAGDAKVGNFNVFNFNSMISHDCITGDNNIFSPGSKVLGWCRMGNNNYLGAGSVMLPKTSIGNNNIIGANATLNRNFKNSLTLIGTPAKEYKIKKLKHNNVDYFVLQ